jgi:hypothetical protein
MVWPSRARRSHPPRSAGAAATPMGRKREFSIAPVAMAVAAPPPAASTAVAPNCAEPANTRTDMAIAATEPMTGAATTPNVADSTNTPGTKARPARIPDR